MTSKGCFSPESGEANLRFLDPNELGSVDAQAFQKQQPYPWINPSGLVTEDGFRELRENLPDISLFRKTFDKQRKYGQKSHDRFALKYDDTLSESLPAPWRNFISELHGDDYKSFLCRTLKVRNFNLSFFWFFTPRGCSVSPHCDHVNKIGAHLFYLNTEDDWDPAWGGETEVLIPGRKLRRTSAPEFSDFASAIAGKTTGTHTFLFKRTRNSWHGVREIGCPEGHMRKVFMVSIQHTSALSKFYHLMAA